MKVRISYWYSIVKTISQLREIQKLHWRQLKSTSSMRSPFLAISFSNRFRQYQHIFDHQIWFRSASIPFNNENAKKKKEDSAYLIYNAFKPEIKKTLGLFSSAHVSPFATPRNSQCSETREQLLHFNAFPIRFIALNWNRSSKALDNHVQCLCVDVTASAPFHYQS